MALVVLWAVLKIPVMSPGDTPPRCEGCRRRRLRRWRRGILTLAVPGRLRAFLNRVGGRQTRRGAIDFGFASILVDRGDGIGMRDAG